MPGESNTSAVDEPARRRGPVAVAFRALRVGTPVLAGLLRDTASRWRAHSTSLIAAGLSYYTVLAFAPSLLILLSVADWVLGEEVALGRLRDLIQRSFAPELAQAIGVLLDLVVRSAPGLLTNLIGALALGYAATSAFVYLQEALNRVWNVPEPAGRGISGLIKTRLAAFALVLALGFVLFFMTWAYAMLSLLTNVYGDPQLLAFIELSQVLYRLVMLLVLTGLFSALYKYLPETYVAWRDVWLGGLASAAVWTGGTLAIGTFLGHSRIASAYGAAGSFVIFLVFVFLSANVFLLGAEFACAFAERYGSRAGDAPVLASAGR